MSETSRPSKPAGKSSSRPSAPRSGPPQLPPRVVKKKKPVKRESSGAKRQSGPSDPPSEFLIPLILVVVGLAGTAATTVMLRPESIPLGLWVAIRMTIVVVSALLTYGALFIAAQVLDTDYGYISTGALKVAAITLTQDWVGDVATKIPVPFLPWIVAVVTTYGMFMYFFDLDLREAISSVVVVRLVHFLAFVLLFVGIIGVVAGGKGVDLSVPAAVLGSGDADKMEDDEEEPVDARDIPIDFREMDAN
ncbi:MAG: hypothetical protein ACM3U2_19965 [Deltaproteobacteria bacterium]